MKNLHLYHPKWSLISRLVRGKRAADRCENCGVDNHAVVCRVREGDYIRTSGDDFYDACGFGRDEYGNRLTYRQAMEVASLLNSQGPEFLPKNAAGNWIVIVLTVAHLDQRRSNNRFWNLKALCQRCHFAHDRKANIQRRKLGSDCYDRPNLFSSAQASSGQEPSGNL